MPAAKSSLLSSRAPDEEHDQIGSTSSTPPGAVTPQPDPSDKRLPGISHNYFGQVRNLFRVYSSHSFFNPQHSSPGRGTVLSTSEHTMGSLMMLSTYRPSALHEQLGDSKSTFNFNQTSTCLSAPSLNSPHSRRESLARSNGSVSSYDLCYDVQSSRTSLSRRSSEVKSSSGLRGYSFATAAPVSGVVASSPAPAELISNPVAKTISQSLTPLKSLLAISSRASCSALAKEDMRLTKGASPSREQSTPPQTPRSRSRETENDSGATTPSKLSKTIRTEGTTIGPVLGKLTVVINEGRGLRASVDPYVVCEFQLSQYISEGPISSGPSNKVENGSGAISIQSVAGKGRPMAIPMRSRQSSSSGRDSRAAQEVTNPKWDHKAVFDVVGEHAEIAVSVYDRTNQEAFLGHVRFCPTLKEYEVPYDGWFDLEARNAREQGTVQGQIRLKIGFQKTDKKHYGPEDFEVLKLIGKGTFGQVFQVRKRDTQRIYAMKVLSKKVIIQKKEIAHTIGERNILVRTAMTDSPFIVGLKFSFQTPSDLYLVTDYMSGGELFWHLQREGRFNETRAKFYIAELILALEHLHRHNIVYRDLKPENILLDANGHIALCDFGLSKANLVGSETTNTFCGTTEYLAPEVLLDEQGYTKMVDYWSLGVLVFEMCCGWSPFYADDTQQMYRNIAFGKVRFPRDALSTEGRNFVKGLLNRNPKHRLGANGGAKELRTHPFFADVDWEALGKKKVVPPFKPKLKGELDVSNFDPEFTNARAAAMASGINPASTPLSPTVQAKFEGFTFVDESAIEKQFANRSTDDLSRSASREDNDDDWEKIERSNRMSGLHHSTDDLIHGRFED